MNTRTPAAVLGEWYTGELGGEALFWQLASGAEPAQARKWLALAEVEARVATRLLDVIAIDANEPPDGVGAISWARERALALDGTAWLEKMQWLEQIAGEALTEMRRDAATLPAHLAAIGALVLAQESALLEFARAERSGHEATSLAPIHAFLRSTA